jgi:hypothetical protein
MGNLARRTPQCRNPLSLTASSASSSSQTHTSGIPGEDPQDFATDLLADLQHWSAAGGIWLETSLRRAQMHFAAEQLEEGWSH